MDETNEILLQKSINELPKEIMLMIFSMLTIDSLGRARCVSKEWREMVGQSKLELTTDEPWLNILTNFAPKHPNRPFLDRYYDPKIMYTNAMAANYFQSLKKLKLTTCSTWQETLLIQIKSLAHLELPPFYDHLTKIDCLSLKFLKFETDLKLLDITNPESITSIVTNHIDENLSIFQNVEFLRTRKFEIIDAPFLNGSLI